MTMDPSRLARFPFLEEAREYAAESGILIEELLVRPSYEEARNRGRARILGALEQSDAGERAMSTDFEGLMEVMSYPVARMMVSAIGDKFLVKRYALSEGVALNRRLQEEEGAMALQVARELGVEAVEVGGELRMHFADFLRFTSKMRSKEWKLVNTEVHNGKVMLTRTRFARVLQQALQDRIESELPLSLSSEMSAALEPNLPDIRARLDEKRKRYSMQGMGEVKADRFPPCMKRLLAMTQAGENLPHSGRFAITSFLHTIGLDSEEILKLFSTSPDFDASKSRYQIQHITGEVSGTEYTPPECSTMRSYGLCQDTDRTCGRVKHPLSYYRRRMSRGGDQGASVE